MLRYGIYARKSDDNKEVTEKSIGEQVAEMRQVAAQGALHVVSVDEESKTAMIPGVRPIFRDLVRRIESGEINALLCWKVNRLARNMKEGGELSQLLIDGTLQEIRTPFAVYRPGDNILPFVLETATSTQYSLDLRDNVRRGMLGHAERGGWNSKAYVGYRNDRHPINPKIGIIAPDGERFDVLRKGWEMMLTGAYTPYQVAEHLNTVWGFRTRQTEKAGGKPLSRSYAYRVFTNPFYAGYVRYKGELRKGSHDPMVTETEFQNVQAILRDAARPAQSLVKETQSRPPAFTGLMRCGYCGSQITAEHHTLSNGNPYVYYRCSDSRGTCTKRGISGRVLEAELIRLLSSITIDTVLCDRAYENIIRWMESRSDEAAVAARQQEAALADVEKQRTNLVAMWLRGLLTEEAEYRRLRSELEQQRDDLLLSAAATRDEMDTVRANARNSCAYIKFARNNFLVSDMEKKREIASALCIRYRLFGREKTLEPEVDPLLVEVVRFASDAAHQPRDTSFKRNEFPIANGNAAGGSRVIRYSSVKISAFEPSKTGSHSRKSRVYGEPVLAGRGAETIIEFPEPSEHLINLLRTSRFPDLQLAG